MLEEIEQAFGLVRDAVKEMNLHRDAFKAAEDEMSRQAAEVQRLWAQVTIDFESVLKDVKVKTAGGISVPAVERFLEHQLLINIGDNRLYAILDDGVHVFGPDTNSARNCLMCGRTMFWPTLPQLSVLADEAAIKAAEARMAEAIELGGEEIVVTKISDKVTRIDQIRRAQPEPVVDVTNDEPGGFLKGE